jgi:hypothetical protein
MDVPLTRLSLPLAEAQASADTGSFLLVYVEEPPVTEPVTTYSELPLGQLVPDWFTLMEMVVVP